MTRSYSLACLAFVAAFILPVSTTLAQFKFPTEEVPKTEPEYIAKAKTAALPSVANNATITMPQADGSTKIVQKGTNGFTCFILSDGSPECDDQNAVEWGQALDEKKPLPNKVGLIYMLAGDTGTSNHDSSHRTLSVKSSPGFYTCDDRRRRHCARDAEELPERSGCQRSDAALRHVPWQAQPAPDDPGTHGAGPGDRDDHPISAALTFPPCLRPVARRGFPLLIVHYGC